MPNANDLPPDLRPAQPARAPAVGPTGRPFIGSNHPGYPGAKPTPPDGSALKAAEVPVDEGAKKKEPDGTPCVRCKAPLLAEAAYCHGCGLDLQRKRAAEVIGIEITDDDLQNYLFKGFLVKEVVLFGGHKATFKSIQAKEIDEADMLTEEHFRDRRPTDVEWINYRSKVIMAFGVAKVDGRSLGDSPKLRLEYIQGQGSQMIELVGKKLQLFNQAITEVLNGDVLGKS